MKLKYKHFLKINNFFDQLQLKGKIKIKTDDEKKANLILIQLTNFLFLPLYNKYGKMKGSELKNI